MKSVPLLKIWYQLGNAISSLRKTRHPKLIASQQGWRENYSLFEMVSGAHRRKAGLQKLELHTDFTAKDFKWLESLPFGLGRSKLNNRVPPYNCSLITAGPVAAVLKAVFPGGGVQHLIYSFFVQLMMLSRIQKHDVVVGYARELYLIAVFSNAKIIMIQHDVVYFQWNIRASLSKRLICYLNKIELRRASHIIAHSEYSKQTLMKLQLSPDEAIRVIAPIPKKSLFYRSDPEGCSATSVCFIGRCTKEKGFDVFESVSRHFQNRDEVEFHAFGAIDKTHSCPSNVQIHGPVINEVLERFLSRGVILLFPTKSDGFGIAQFDVLKHGGIVISSPNCGIPECEEIGKFVVDNTPNAYISKIEDIISGHLVLKDNRKASFFARYSAEAAITKFEEVLSDVI